MQRSNLTEKSSLEPVSWNAMVLLSKSTAMTLELKNTRMLLEPTASFNKASLKSALSIEFIH